MTFACGGAFVYVNVCTFGTNTLTIAQWTTRTKGIDRAKICSFSFHSIFSLLRFVNLNFRVCVCVCTCIGHSPLRTQTQKQFQQQQLLIHIQMWNIRKKMAAIVINCVVMMNKVVCAVPISICIIHSFFLLSSTY